MEQEVKNKLLKIINDDLDALHLEMKELDRQYIEKQKRVREIKRAKADLIK